MSKPVVAIVGRPNVGKSTLFNTLAGERISIVKDTPGVTRDRIYADVSWLDKEFTMIDTGGIEPDSSDIILSQMREQAQIAIDTADVIVFITDVRQGLVDADSKVADMLRRSKKPVVLVVNKVDNFDKFMPDVYEFYNLGIGDPVPISAASRLGIGDMLDEVVSHFPEGAGETEEDERPKIAIVGKPNVGKASIVNYFLGSVGRVLARALLSREGGRRMLEDFHGEIHAVHAAHRQMIVAGISPLVLREVVIECRALLVLFPHKILHVPRLLLIDLLGPLGPEGQRGMDKDVEQVLPLPQHIVGAAAHDDAGPLLGHLADDLALDQEDLVVHGQLLGAHVQAVEEAGGLHLLGFLDVLLRQAALLGGHQDEFLVIKRDPKFLGQALANGASAGAVFSGNGDHWDVHGTLGLVRDALSLVTIF